MSCSPFDLKDYFLQELTDPQRRQVEAHVKTCSPCREEMDRLQMTEAALLSLRDEEIPQRIAFVSDKIFEPSPLARWWAGFWGSAARLGFASAAMLSAAIVVYALHPVQPVANLPAPAPPQSVKTVSYNDADIQSRIDAAVTKAVAQVESKDEVRARQLTAELVSAQKMLKWAADDLDRSERKANNARVMAGGYGMPALPEGK
jgi:anti-sigma factor RsiW